jgi:hypothetical protein
MFVIPFGKGIDKLFSHFFRCFFLTHLFSHSIFNLVEYKVKGFFSYTLRINEDGFISLQSTSIPPLKCIKSIA